jgi:hypothetical protein
MLRALTACTRARSPGGPAGGGPRGWLDGGSPPSAPAQWPPGGYLRGGGSAVRALRGTPGSGIELPAGAGAPAPPGPLRDVRWRPASDSARRGGSCAPWGAPRLPGSERQLAYRSGPHRGYRGRGRKDQLLFKSLVIQVSLAENSNTYEYQEPPTCDTTRTATA